MDVEERQEMLDVGVKKSGRGAPSSVGCVPCWRLADMEFVKSFTKSEGWFSLHDVSLERTSAQYFLPCFDL